MSLTFHERMDDTAQSSRLTANDSEEGIVNVLHPVVSKKRKFMDLTRDPEKNIREPGRSGAKRTREKSLIIREPQNSEITNGEQKSSNGETSEVKAITRDSLVFVPEVVKVEKPRPPETWGEDEETPTQPAESDENLSLIYERTSESLDHAESSERDSVSPVEEYIMVVERLIRKGKLSPRSTEVLRRNLNRYKLTLRGAEQTAESAETSKDTIILSAIKSDLKKLLPDFLNIFSSESDQDLPIERADSVIPIETKRTEAMGVDESLAEEAEKARKTKRASSSQEAIDDKTGGSNSSSESMKKILEEMSKEKEKVEAENREIQSAVLTKFEESLKDSCHLESFTIEDPFSDFSLHNVKQDTVLKERIIQSQQEEEVVPAEEAEYEEIEPSTSKIQRSVHYEDDGKEPEEHEVFPDALRDGDDSMRDEILLSSGPSEIDFPEKTYLDDSTQEPAIERFRIGELVEESLDEMKIIESADTLPSISDTTVVDDKTEMKIDGHPIESQAGTSGVKDKISVDDQTIITDTIKEPVDLTDVLETSDSVRDKTAVSQKKRCAKCGMRVFVTESTQEAVSEKNKKRRMKSEHDRIFTLKKSGVKCKCGCVMKTENEEDPDEENPMTVIRCILNYFFPLATEYLVPRQTIKIIFNGCL